MKRLASLVALVFLASGCARGIAAQAPAPTPRPASSKTDEDATREEIAELLRETLEADPEHRAVGVILMDGAETSVFGFGPRNPKDARPMDADTTFELGSIAKTMVGVLLADAIGRGEVGLDDPAEKWLPQGFSLSSKLKSVTLAHLATHTTGFPWFPDNWTGVDPRTHRTRYTKQAFADFLRTYEPAEPPGASYRYGNTDTALLALLLSERAHRPFRAMLAERLFQRLGMQRSELSDRWETDDNRLAGYTADGFATPRIDDSPFAPSCAIRSTLGDMKRYMHAATGDASPLRAAFSLSQKPRVALDADGFRHVALGWETNSRFDSVSKNGVVEGYRTSLTLFPKKRQGVFVIANGENVETEAIARDILTYQLGTEPVGLLDHSRFVVKEVPADATPVAAAFNNQMRLEGIRAPSCARPGETFPVSLFFHALEETSGDFRIFVHADAPIGGAARLRADHFPNGGKDSTLRWLADEIVRDDFEIAVPKDYSGKSVVLWLGLYDERGRLAASDERGESEVVDDRFRGPSVTIGACL